MSVPDPVYSLAVEPLSSSKQAAMDEALAIMAREDPSLKVEVDPETGQVKVMVEDAS